MPRLICTYRTFIDILLQHGFELHSQGATSHRRYRGVVEGKVVLVDVAVHGWTDEIPLGTLKSMIRQSGLSQALFRK